MSRTAESMDLPADYEEKPMKAASQIRSITTDAAVCLKEAWVAAAQDPDSMLIIE